jgi:hypothetical protein
MLSACFLWEGGILVVSEEESKSVSVVPVRTCLGCGRKLPAGLRSSYCSYECFLKFKGGGS